MGFWKDVSPRRALADLNRVIIDNRGRHLLPALLAIAVTSVLIGGFVLAGSAGLAPVGQDVVYVESWSADRTEEQILRDRWEIQCEKDRRRAQVQGAYVALGRATGIDTREAEAQAEAATQGREDLPGYEYAEC